MLQYTLTLRKINVEVKTNRYFRYVGRKQKMVYWLYYNFIFLDNSYNHLTKNQNKLIILAIVGTA